ncbi:MAG: hypothetical protein ACLTOV_00775 [Phocaeicola sp.]
MTAKKSPVIRLTRASSVRHRPAAIVMSAHAINQGRFPDNQQRKEKQTFFIQQEDSGKSSGGYCKLGKKPSAESLQPKNTSQICKCSLPMQRGVVGAANPNMALQNALESALQRLLNRGGYSFPAKATA